MNKSTKVILTLECIKMKDPKNQRSLLDQTLSEASWMLKENLSPEIHNDGTVSTKSVWEKVFGSRKKREDIDRLIQNLVNRAMAYANIDNHELKLDFVQVNTAQAAKISPHVLFSED